MRGGEGVVAGRWKATVGNSSVPRLFESSLLSLPSLGPSRATDQRRAVARGDLSLSSHVTNELLYVDLHSDTLSSLHSLV